VNGKTTYVLLAVLAIFVALWVMVGPLFTEVQRISKVSRLEDYIPSKGTRIYDRQNRPLAKFYVERRIVVPFHRIPRPLVQAILAIEDKKFYHHNGIDIRGLARAVYQNLRAGRVVQGGSMITQQLSRVLFLTREVSLTRKITEAVLALIIEQTFSKQEILALYLNQAYLGRGAYGVEGAARAYFNKGVDHLNLEEAALLAALLKAPSKYSPVRYPDRARSRRNLVLQRMQEVGFISPDEAQEAQNTPLRVAQDWNTQRTKQFSGVRRRAIVEPEARHFVETVVRELPKVLGQGFQRDELYRKGLRVYTTLDLELQQTARKVTLKRLRDLDYRRGIDWVPEGLPPTEGALVALDPQTSDVLAMVGGRDFEKSQFNRATQAFRQPGSTFKPFVYATALERGLSPRAIVLDIPRSFQDPVTGKLWRPNNYGGRFYRYVTLQKALEKSLNAATIRLAERVGIERVCELAQRLGIQSPLRSNLALALGDSEVSLLEMTSAYATIASGGLRSKPNTIDRVESADGRTHYEKYSGIKRAMDRKTAQVLTHMMRKVVERGTAKKAKVLGPAVVGKTGTTDNNRDAWFIGFSPNLVMGVWVGLDSNQSLGQGESGSRAALPIWIEAMGAWLKDHPIRTDPAPVHYSYRFAASSPSIYYSQPF
jgi:penicillin-binding protein 1A